MGSTLALALSAVLLRRVAVAVGGSASVQSARPPLGGRSSADQAMTEGRRASPAASAACWTARATFGTRSWLKTEGTT